jgi:hypothetical protein
MHDMIYIRGFCERRLLLSLSLSFLACGLVQAQENHPVITGIVDDWSHHHVIFSDPGSEEDAIANGRHEAWQRIFNNSRYQMQQFRRYAKREQPTENSDFNKNGWQNVADRDAEWRGRERKKMPPPATGTDLGRDWSQVITATAANAGAVDMYPAKFSFNLSATPTCTDFVVFPINGAGSSSAANLIALTNLYKTTCTGTVPSVMFAYNIGAGSVRTSPVLSENGTKIAFVESNSTTNTAIFHVLTIGTTGSNGTAYTAPATPGTGNNASLVSITLSGNYYDTRSSPFIDYTNDIAYVGDNQGYLHKITGVFNGTPTEVTTGGWPFMVDAANAPVELTSPVFDGGTSQSVFVAGGYGTANNGNGTGKIYCVLPSGSACTTKSIVTGAGVQDGPLLDSTNETIITAQYATGGTASSITQVSTSLASSSLVTVTYGSNAMNPYNGTFDNAYYTSPASGHFYFCGPVTSPYTSTLYRVGFSSSGKMNSSTDGNTLQLTSAFIAGGGSDCTPLTEVFNPNQGTSGTDYLFLGVRSDGNPTGCSNEACIMNFNITSSFPTAPIATLPVGTTTNGTSGIVVDNVSTATGTSQIYIGNMNTGAGVQASQAGLQ